MRSSQTAGVVKKSRSEFPTSADDKCQIYVKMNIIIALYQINRAIGGLNSHFFSLKM